MHHMYSLNENYFLLFLCLQLAFIYLLCGYLTQSPPFWEIHVQHGQVCFKLTMTVWLVYVGVHMSFHNSPSYFNATFSRTFILKLKPIGTSVWTRIHLSSWAFINVILPNSFWILSVMVKYTCLWKSWSFKLKCFSTSISLLKSIDFRLWIIFIVRLYLHFNGCLSRAFSVYGLLNSCF